MKHKRIRRTLLWGNIWIFVFLFIAKPFGVYAQKGDEQKDQKTTLAGFYENRTYNKSADSDAGRKLNTIVSLKKGKQKLITELELIADQVGLELSYSEQFVPMNKQIYIKQTKLTARKALLKVLKGTSISYAVYSKQLVLLRKRKNEFQAKQDVISGTVTDAGNKEALPGVNIIIKGTTIGTSTDQNGKYKLEVSSLQDTLVFSYIGYQRMTVPINGRTHISVSLTMKVLNGQELVVVGYGTQQKKDLTGSIATVKSKDLGSQPVPSLSDALQGRASGVQVISSGVPGNDATFRIRGTGTINNSNPLIVIDGVPTTSGFNMLNPNDIESIQVLKDASAAAIYGSRGANGVVIVTTKSGKGSKNQFNVDVYRGIQQVTNTIPMLNASQFARLSNDMLANNGLPQNPDFSKPASLGNGTDWLGRLFHVSPIQNYSISYSGGNEKSNFYVSGNILDQNGTIISTGYKRYTVQFNSDTRLFDRLTFGNKLTLNHDVKTSGSYSIKNTMAALPTQPIFNSDGTYSGPTGRSSWVGDIVNPIGQARLIDNSTKGYNIIGSVYGKLEITKYLKFKSDFGIKANFWDGRTWSPKYNWQPNPQTESYLSENYNKNITWLVDNTLTYDRLFKNIHHVTVLLGTSAQHNRFDFINGSVQGFASDRTQQITNGINPPTLGGDASEWSLLSFMGRVNYSYNDTYLATATLRRDGSSRFGSGHKWGLFPSGSIAWRISNEKFFKPVKFISDLKLRAGYGITGNQEIGNYSFASVLQTVQYNFNNSLVSAVVPTVMPNPNVHWEQVEQYNLGLDATMFNERVNVTIDTYIKNTNDMLVPMSVPVTTGYSDINVPSVNAGKIQNKGVELSVSSKNLRGKLNWNTDFNISYNLNKVVSLNDTIPLPTGNIDFNYNVARLEAGHPVNEFYGYVTNGIFQNQNQVNIYATQVPGADPYNRTSPGDIRFVDLNNDGVINDKDRAYIGNPNPDFIFSLNNSFTYKNFDFSIFLQGVYGNKIFNANRIWDEGMSSAQNQTTATLHRWTGSGTSNAMPRAVYGDPNGNTRASTRYVEDGSYLRVKNVTLGYTVPNSISRKLSLSSGRIYLSAENIFTITRYSGIDPEVPVNGIDLNVYPVARTISMGLDLSF